MNEPQTNTRLNRVPLWAVGCAIFALVAASYIGMPDRQYRDDILAYSMAAETGERLFLPNHLLYPALIRSLWLVHTDIQPDARALDTANLVNLVFGLSTVALFFLFNLRLTQNRLTSALFTLGFAFAYDTWSYASSGETYIIPLFFMMLSYVFLARSAELHLRTVLWIASIIALAALIHQSYVLLLVPIGLQIFFQHRKIGAVVLLYAITGFICIATYAWVGITEQSVSSVSELIDWARGYVGSPSYGRFEGIDSFLDAVIGFANSLTDLKRIRDTILVHGQFSATLPAIGSLVGLAIVGIGLAGCMLRTTLSFNTMEPKTHLWFWNLLFHLIFFSAVAIYWSPSDHKFWAPVIFPLFTLFHFGVAWKGPVWRRASIVLAGCLVATIWILNAFVGVHKLDDTNEYQTAQKIAELVPENALVLLPNSHVWRYVDYFFPTKHIAFDSLYNTDGTDTYAQALEQAMRNSHAAYGLFISEDEIRPSEWRTNPFEFLTADDYTAFYNENIEAKEPVLDFAAFGDEYSLFRVTRLRNGQ